MNKRGVDTRQILYVAYILMCLAVFLFLYGEVKGEAKGETFHQIYSAVDIASAINLFGNGNLTVEYPLKYDFNFAVAEGKVAVRKETTVIYPYSEGKYYSIEAKKEGDKLILRKI